MSDALERHKRLTVHRATAYALLFGGPPSSVFPPHALFKKPDERFLIDVFVYRLKTSTGDIEVAVTNGMSDQRMVGADALIDRMETVDLPWVFDEVNRPALVD